MGDCKYYITLNGHTVVLNSDKELTSYIEDNIVISPEQQISIKYSLTGTEAQSKILETFKKIQSIDTTIMNPYNFMEEYHNIKGKSQLLVPKVIDAEYKADLERTLSIELHNPTPEVLKIAVEQKLKADKFMKGLSSDLSRIFRARLYSLEHRTNFDRKFLNETISKIISFNDQISNKHTTIDNVLLQNLGDKILSALDIQILDMLDHKGILQVGQSLTVNDSLINDQVHMSASAHILDIKEDGVVHLFEIKVSGDPYQK